MTTGKQLRLLRIRSEITVTAVAARMGLSRQSVWVLERSAEVTEDRALAYRRAVRDATVTTTDGTAA